MLANLEELTFDNADLTEKAKNLEMEVAKLRSTAARRRAPPAPAVQRLPSAAVPAQRPPGLDPAVDGLSKSPGMRLAQAMGLELNEEAMQKLLTLPVQQASELLETVSAKRGTIRSPSKYVCATISKGYVSNGAYRWSSWRPGAEPLPEDA